MIIEKSNINYVHFGVIGLNYKCNTPKENETISSDLDIDMSYDILKIDKHKNLFQVVLELILTTPNNLPGYNISLKFLGVFELPETKDKKKIDKMLIFTCIPLVLGNARGFIAEITAHFPFGKYLLPSISVQSIIAAYQQ